MKYERDVFFDEVRDSLFSGALEQIHVDGMSVILAVWEHDAGGTPMTDERWLAYMLATTYHECATRMWPIEEYGKGAGHEYGKVDPETGFAYYARGFVGLTWKDNYQKASAALGLIDERDLVWNPGLALDSLIAARVMFRGMAEGWFTGRKLGQYFDEDTDDPINARQIINGNDQDELIAGYHEAFLDALRLARIPDAVAPGAVEVIDIALNRSSKNLLVSITLDDHVILAAGT
jgi:putative chitinase